MVENNNIINEDKKVPLEIDIGNLLSSKREAIGKSIKSVSMSIKLSQYIIDGLEKNDFSKVGTSVYVRGYLGIYAKYLDLDVSNIIGIYDSQYPADNISIKPAISNYMGNKNKRFSKSFSLFVSVIAFLILMYGYYRLEPLFFNSNAKVNLELENKEVKGIPSNIFDKNLIDIDNVKEDNNILKDDSSINISSENKKEDLVSDLNIDGITLESTSDSYVGKSDSIDLDSDTNKLPISDLTLDKSDIAENIEKKTLSEVSLDIFFKDECWISIANSNGKRIVSGIYSPSRPINIKLATPIKLKVGRILAIKSISIDGNPININNYRVGKHRFEIK